MRAVSWLFLVVPARDGLGVVHARMGARQNLILDVSDRMCLAFFPAGDARSSVVFALPLPDSGNAPGGGTGVLPFLLAGIGRTRGRRR